MEKKGAPSALIRDGYKHQLLTSWFFLNNLGGPEPTSGSWFFINKRYLVRALTDKVADRDDATDAIGHQGSNFMPFYVFREFHYGVARPSRRNWLLTFFCDNDLYTVSLNLKFANTFTTRGLFSGWRFFENVLTWLKRMLNIDPLRFLPYLLMDRYQVPFKLNWIRVSNRRYPIAAPFTHELFMYHHLLLVLRQSARCHRNIGRAFDRVFEEFIAFLYQTPRSFALQRFDLMFEQAFESRSFTHYRSGRRLLHGTRHRRRRILWPDSVAEAETAENP